MFSFRKENIFVTYMFPHLARRVQKTYFPTTIVLIGPYRTVAWLQPATARYFYDLNTYGAILLQKLKYLKTFLNFFASGSNISMVIYDLSKYNCHMGYHEEAMA